MKRAIRTTIASMAMVVSLLFWPAGAFAQLVEVEPNDTCEQALINGSIAYVVPGETVVNGELAEVYDWPRDVDFMLFEGEAGARLVVNMRGAYGGDGTLVDPFLGLFDSGCGLLDYNDDDGTSLNSEIYFEVPADGAFILAATGCCDWTFSGEHGHFGTYTLAFSNQPPTIGSISGRVVDAVSGNTLPWAWLNLMHCEDSVCEYLESWGSSDENGHFLFTQGMNGRPLRVGTFLIRVWYSDGYEPAEYGPFDVGEGEHYDTGDIGLLPPPPPRVTFGAVTPCENLPPSGGTCRYEVVVNNNWPERLQGLAWSNVQAYNTGSVWGYSHFTASREQKTNIKGLSSTTLRFSFDVPAGVADGAYICVDAWVSDRENAFLGTIRQEQLFCVHKIWSGYRAVAPEVAEALRTRPHGPPSKVSTKRAQ